MPTIPRDNTSHRRRACFLSSYLRRSRPRTRAKQFQAEFEAGPEFAGSRVSELPTLWAKLTPSGTAHERVRPLLLSGSDSFGTEQGNTDGQVDVNQCKYELQCCIHG